MDSMPVFGGHERRTSAMVPRWAGSALWTRAGLPLCVLLLPIGQFKQESLPCPSPGLFGIRVNMSQVEILPKRSVARDS